MNKKFITMFFLETILLSSIILGRIPCDYEGQHTRLHVNNDRCYICQPPTWVEVDQCDCCIDTDVDGLRDYCIDGSNNEDDPIYVNCAFKM